jgi:hypothetical protein
MLFVTDKPESGGDRRRHRPTSPLCLPQPIQNSRAFRVAIWRFGNPYWASGHYCRAPPRPPQGQSAISLMAGPAKRRSQEPPGKGKGKEIRPS